jgi:DnaJ-class molecular chaperone
MNQINKQKPARSINHYQTLGITRNASQGDIRSAYKKMALQMHPVI